MKFGHTTGLKKERTGATPEFDRLQGEHLARIEAEWHVKPAIDRATLPPAMRTMHPAAIAWMEELRQKLVRQAAEDARKAQQLVNAA